MVQAEIAIEMAYRANRNGNKNFITFHHVYSVRIVRLICLVGNFFIYLACILIAH